MDFESDLCFENYTDNMAASKAPPTNTINVSSSISSSTSTTTDTTTIIIENNFHELCRSCGKTNAELYDLFQTTNSPFSTSSTTCYTHLNNCSFTASTNSTSSSLCSTITATTNKPSTSTTIFGAAAAGCTKSTVPPTFDSMAATAKATAKGQSNMDNILQEMQIWQLMIKCNDGLPQRICAKCTAQFYMIHKFRRKCLKVQTQLRALYEEEQKFYERQQQQKKEKNVTVKDATIEATSTPASTVPAPVAAVPVAVAEVVPERETDLLVEVVKPPVMHKVNDLVNDNYCEPQQAVVDNTNTKSSVSFEANTGNTNDFVAPSTTAATTLLDNVVVETMPQKTEANEPTPTISAPAFMDKTFEARIQEEHVTFTTGLKLKDEKKPLLKPAVLDSKRSPPLTLQQPLEQICDNDTTTAGQTNASKKPCLDQENFLSTHIKFKSINKQNNNNIKQYQKNAGQTAEKDENMATENTFSSSSSPALNLSSTVLPVLTKSNEIFKLRLYEQLKLPQDCGGGLSRTNSENLFLTKAALKAYTIPPSTSETRENRDQQKPITNSEAIELKNTNNNNNNNENNINSNDNNNNAHRIIYTHPNDNRSQLNDNTCSSTSNSTPSPHSSSSRKPDRTNTHGRKIIKYSYHNRRPGHCYKSNGKATATTTRTAAEALVSASAATKKARTILSYGGGMVVKRKPRSQRDKNKLKHCRRRCRLSPQTKTSSTCAKTTRRKKPKKNQQKLNMSHKRSIQMEDEMSSSTVSTTSSTSSSAISSSTSSHLRATTPAVTDLVRNCAEATSYCKNTNENMNNKKDDCWSSADRLSSNNSCIMWKTKAAMKANTNDMPAMEVVLYNDDEDDDGGDDGEPTSNIPEISLPYTASIMPTGSTPTATVTPALSSSSLVLSASLATETEIEREADKSSKTLYDENQSIAEQSSSCLKNNNNNNLNEEYCTTSNKVTMSASSSPDNQVKDISKDKYVHLPKIKIANHNLWPEEAADQNQINTSNQNNQTDNEENTVEFVETNNQQPIELIPSDSHENVEKLKKDQQQKPTIDTSPPPKVGSMKLIIQRKRGARFKCRRKDDDDETLNTQDKATPAKRKRKSSRNRDLQSKLEMIPFVSLDCEYSKDGEKLIFSKDTLNDETNENNNKQFAEDENKENPIPVINNYEFDSDSNVSLYRDPLLIRNEMLEEDTHVTDFSKTPLSIQTECTKEMYKLYKEKANLESPKKLIVRVPLTSLTQDFKRLHLTMDDDKEDEKEEENPDDLNSQETNEETLSIEVTKQREDEYMPIEQEMSSLQANLSSSQSDFAGFSQTTDASSSSAMVSSQPSMEMMRYAEPPLYSASSKINDFINDFQTNCIDSSEIEESCEMIPTLVPSIPQELSDEIRDVEDTLNGLLSKMHDKDMYTPRSGETDELFSHSVYSPLTDSPTTPSQSFYAESPCTINSNPMSVSPFIHHNMDYNAMTPQSNHSSMGPGSSYMSGGGSTGPHTSVYSEHYHNYNECFEESTQSELIGFQNDIPCFENIEMTNAANLNEEGNEEEEAANSAEQFNNDNVEVEEATKTEDYVDLSAYEEKPDLFVASQPTIVHASTDTLQDESAATPDIQAQQIPYSPANYQPTFQMHNLTSPLISRTTTTTQPHYIVTNTNQGSIIITNPQLNHRRGQIETAFKPHNNNLQFVTLGQAMGANQTQTNPLINNNTTNKINWPTTTVNAAPNFNQQPVISTANGTTTYFINANGELYQANIPTTNSLQNRPVNTIFVPPNTNQTFNKTNIENNDNYMPTMQQQQQPQHTQQQNNGQSSQYIMLVNNLNGSPHYYATTTPTNINQTVSPQQQHQQQQHNIPTPTVLYRPTHAQNVQNNTNFHKNSTSHSTSEENKATHAPVPIALEPPTDATADAQRVHQQITQQLQTQIKQRQQHILQPRHHIVAQKITLICRFCHKRPKFNNNVDYSNHIINTHPAEKPYNCPHCPMHFIRRSERQMHVAQVHGSRYECAQCGLSFCAQRTLDFHLQKYHANLGRSHQHLQLNSSSTTTATTQPATYQLLQHNQQQRLVRVEDVHVQVTGENRNKRSIDLKLDGDGGGVDIKTTQSPNELEILSHTVGAQQQQQHQEQQQQQSRKLCCPDCNGDNDDCCGSNENHDQGDTNSNTTETATNNAQPYTGSESVNNHSLQHNQHVTIPSPEQTEPDSTTTLRHFRKRQIGETHFASISPSSSSSSFSSLHNNVGNNNNGGNDNININDNSAENVLTGNGGAGVGQNTVERTLRGSHNCLLCEESFTNEIALRKHHHLAHGGATQSTTCSSAITSISSLVCTICKRGFRMRNALQRHMETHDAETRPYECNICQVRFPRPSQLTLHKLTVHKFEKPNSCEQCGKQFGTESAMKAHTVDHDEAAIATNATASELSTQSQLPSRIYLEPATTTTTTPIVAPPINLQSSMSGEDCATESALTNNNDDEFNNATTQDIIVSQLVS